MLTSMVKRMASAFKEERGQVLIWVAGFFILFLGIVAIVVDVGFWLSDRRNAQNQADALALAGAQELPFGTDAATAIVYEWASANNLPADQVEKIEFEDANGNPCSGTNCSLVRVFVKRESGILMAQVLDIFSASVRVKAAAIIKPLSGVCPFPWAIPAVNPALGADGLWGLSPGSMYVFQDSDFETPGNFGALAVLGQGDRIYRDTISGVACEEGVSCESDDTNVCFDTLCGSDAELTLAPGDSLSCSTQTGSLGGTTEDALIERYSPNADAECDAQTFFQASIVFNSIPACQDRLGAIFIIDAFPASGSSEDVQVLGVAWFYISGWDRWSPKGDGDLDGIPNTGFVWGYLTGRQAADIWNFNSIVSPFAPVVGVLVE